VNAQLFFKPLSFLIRFIFFLTYFCSFSLQLSHKSHSLLWVNWRP